MEDIDHQMGTNMKSWQNPYNFDHEYSERMNYQTSKAILGSGCTSKDTLDIMDGNILKCS